MKQSPQTSYGDTFFRTTLVPLFLMIVSPVAVQFVWVVCYHHNGDAISALSTPPSVLASQFPTPSFTAAFLALFFLLVQCFLLVAIPGPTFAAIPTPMGNRPTYFINGVPAFVVTHAALAWAANAGLIRYGMLYDHFGPMLAFLGRSAIFVTVLLYIRGITYPTNSDSGRTGHGFIWDMWHGTELHPEIWGLSLKQLINCRFAMMGWSVAITAFACKQVELTGYLTNSMFVSTFLQSVYIFKFFLWEGGYFNSVRWHQMFAPDSPFIVASGSIADCGSHCAF